MSPSTCRRWSTSGSTPRTSASASETGAAAPSAARVVRAFDLALLRVLRTRGHSLRAELRVGAWSSAGEHGLIWHSLALAGAAVDGGNRAVYLRTMRAVLVAFAANTLL